MKLWIGLAQLKGNPNCKDFRRFGDGKGAFVWVAAWAESRAAFEMHVKAASEDLDCILCNLEDVELMDARIDAGGCPEEFIEMRGTAIRQPKDTVFGTFHTWLQDDSN
jgi:hypothetical protein